MLKPTNPAMIRKTTRVFRTPRAPEGRRFGGRFGGGAGGAASTGFGFGGAGGVGTVLGFAGIVGRTISGASTCGCGGRGGGGGTIARNRRVTAPRVRINRARASVRAGSGIPHDGSGGIQGGGDGGGS